MFLSSHSNVPIQPAPNVEVQCPQPSHLQKPSAQESTISSCQQPKLRLSCDACAAAKVKCSKERPKCDRCVANETTCIYGPSLKHGKSDKKRKHQDHQATPPTCEASRSSLQKQSSASVSSGHDFYSDLQRSFADLIQQTEGNAGPPTVNQGSFSSTHTMSDNMSSISSLGPFGNTFLPESRRTDSPISSCQDQNLPKNAAPNTFLDPFDSYGPWPSDWDFPTTTNHDRATKNQQQSSDSTVFTQPPENAGHSRTAAHNQMHDCYSIANSTLASLQLRTNPPSRDGSAQSFPAYPVSRSNGCSPVQTFEDLFRINQQAISSVSRLLNCACAGEPYMAMLYASIIVKVLFCYQVAAGLKSSESCTFGSTKSTSNSTICSDLSTPSFDSSLAFPQAKSGTSLSDEASVTREPFRIGSYTPDEDDQEHMRRLLFLSNLRKVGRLIESLAKIGDRVDEGASNLYGALGAWLKSELSRTIKKGANGMEAMVAP